MGKLSALNVCLNILKCLVLFYAVYYCLASVCFAAYKLTTFDGKIPFDFHTWIDFQNCCVGYQAPEIVNLICQILTFVICGIAFGIFILDWVWDYAVTLSIIHIGICCLVMLDFPFNWSWWVCLGFSVVLMICMGEMISYVCRRRHLAKVEPEPQLKPQSYLYKR